MDRYSVTLTGPDTASDALGQHDFRRKGQGVARRSGQQGAFAGRRRPLAVVVVDRLPLPQHQDGRDAIQQPDDHASRGRGQGQDGRQERGDLQEAHAERNPWLTRSSSTCSLTASRSRWRGCKA